MEVFVKTIVFTTKPPFDIKKKYCINARIGGEDNSLRENPHDLLQLMLLIATNAT